MNSKPTVLVALPTAALAVAGALYFSLAPGLESAAVAPAAPSPVPVVAGVVDSHDVPIYLRGVGTVIAHVAKHLDQEHSVAGMAAMAIMSPRHFSRRFREATGTSPTQWLLSMRLTRVRELLEETDEPIDTIARTVGFGSSITLRHHFMRTLQTSPSAYRKTFREPSGATVAEAS